MNDTQRLDFMDEMVKNGSLFELKGHEFFTVATQHQGVDSMREAIDMLVAFEVGIRCWDCEERGSFDENWDRISYTHTGVCKKRELIDQLKKLQTSSKEN